jgi:DNA-binding NarL/FixJ family response regulator
MNSDSNSIRIVIADGHAGLRQELRRVLEQEPDLQVAGEACDVRETVRLARDERPDVVLLDIGLRQNDRVPDSSFVASLAPARIVVMIPAIDKENVIEAFALGAHGLLLRSSPPDVLLGSIRGVVAGQYWLESDSIGVVVGTLRELLSPSRPPAPPKNYGLTRRELDIIVKIVGGSSNKEIGEEFAISERTVKHHLTNVFTKVGVSSRLQLALFAVNHLLTNQPAASLQVRPLEATTET